MYILKISIWTFLFSRFEIPSLSIHVLIGLELTCHIISKFYFSTLSENLFGAAVAATSLNCQGLKKILWPLQSHHNHALTSVSNYHLVLGPTLHSIVLQSYAYYRAFIVLKRRSPPGGSN
jgi:uncharacterized membrane protein